MPYRRAASDARSHERLAIAITSTAGESATAGSTLRRIPAVDRTPQRTPRPPMPTEPSCPPRGGAAAPRERVERDGGEQDDARDDELRAGAHVQQAQPVGDHRDHDAAE